MRLYCNFVLIFEAIDRRLLFNRLWRLKQVSAAASTDPLIWRRFRHDRPAQWSKHYEIRWKSLFEKHWKHGIYLFDKRKSTAIELNWIGSIATCSRSYSISCYTILCVAMKWNCFSKLIRIKTTKSTFLVIKNLNIYVENNWKEKITFVFAFYWKHFVYKFYRWITPSISTRFNCKIKNFPFLLIT